MKMILKLLPTIFFVLMFLLVGGSVGYKFGQDKMNQYVGTPRAEFPPIGSIIRVEAVFEDNTFVGTFAGKRSYFKSPSRTGGIAMVLESNTPYEVVLQKGTLDSAGQVMLVPIRSTK